MQGKKKLYSIVNPKVSQSPRKKALKKKKKKNLTNEQNFEFFLFPIKLNILRVMLLIQHFRTNIITKSR